MAGTEIETEKDNIAGREYYAFSTSGEGFDIPTFQRYCEEVAKNGDLKFVVVENKIYFFPENISVLQFLRVCFRGSMLKDIVMCAGLASSYLIAKGDGLVRARVLHDFSPELVENNILSVDKSEKYKQDVLGKSLKHFRVLVLEQFRNNRED